MVDAITAPDVLHLFIGAVISYLLGSLNGSLLLSKLILKDDIRRHGSGNAGATNVLRTYGKGWTIAVSVWDMGKGTLAVIFVPMLLVWGFGWGSLPEGWLGVNGTFIHWCSVISGFFVIIGHVFPIFFGFKGGKGVITACMVMLLLDPLAACIALAFFFTLLFLTRYLSLGSMAAVFVLPFVTLLLGRGLPRLILTILIAVLVIFLHRANIKRLLSGTENKFGAKKKE